MSKPTTIDPAEQARFERLAKLWWDESGPFWPLHGMNELRAGYIRDQIIHWGGKHADAERPLEGLRILDIGCGGGILSEAIARMGAEVHGVDMIEKNVQIARLHASGQGLNLFYECSTADALTERGETYDAVLNMEVVEHVSDLPLFMRSCARLLKPGGLMMIATINRTLASFCTAIVGAEYVLCWLPRGTHQWRKFPTPAELGELLRADGLTVADRTGVRLNPLNRSFRLVPYVGINYMLVAVKPA
jgi:2-polyprenyl-6-hydroxyphenyl methylase / 3-demethylubiquinone-9 3-methyltransferase